MHKLIAKDFGLRCASNFDVAKPFNYPFIEAFVKAAMREFAGYGIGPNNFARNQGDGLFGYTVSFSLFNGNATFVLNRDGLVSTLSNGQTKADVVLIRDLLDKAHKCIPNPETLSHTMMGFCHAEFQEAGTVDAVLRGVVVTSGPVRPVAVSVVSSDPSEVDLPAKERIRLDIAPSDFRDNHLFMAWHFFARGVLSDDFWKALGPRMGALASSFGIEVVE
jgi:hypothetical protein